MQMQDDEPDEPRAETEAPGAQPDLTEDEVGERCVAMIRGLDDHHAQVRIVRRLRDEFGG